MSKKIRAKQKQSISLSSGLRDIAAAMMMQPLKQGLDFTGWARKYVAPHMHYNKRRHHIETPYDMV